MSRSRYLSDMDKEFARLGLVRTADAMRRLRIDYKALRWLISKGELRLVPVPWRGTIKSGIPAADLDGVEAVYRNGVIHLIKPESQPSP